jgi:hypothetical protein
MMYFYQMKMLESIASAFTRLGILGTRVAPDVALDGLGYTPEGVLDAAWIAEVAFSREDGTLVEELSFDEVFEWAHFDDAARDVIGAVDALSRLGSVAQSLRTRLHNVSVARRAADRAARAGALQPHATFLRYGPHICEVGSEHVVISLEADDVAKITCECYSVVMATTPVAYDTDVENETTDLDELRSEDMSESESEELVSDPLAAGVVESELVDEEGEGPMSDGEGGVLSEDSADPEPSEESEPSTPSEESEEETASEEDEEADGEGEEDEEEEEDGNGEEDGWGEEGEGEEEYEEEDMYEDATSATAGPSFITQRILVSLSTVHTSRARMIHFRIGWLVLNFFKIYLSDSPHRSPFVSIGDLEPDKQYRLHFRGLAKSHRSPRGEEGEATAAFQTAPQYVASGREARALVAVVCAEDGTSELVQGVNSANEKLARVQNAIRAELITLQTVEKKITTLSEEGAEDGALVAATAAPADGGDELAPISLVATSRAGGPQSKGLRRASEERFDVIERIDLARAELASSRRLLNVALHALNR